MSPHGISPGSSMWDTGHRLQKISKGSGGTGPTGPGSLLFPIRSESLGLGPHCLIWLLSGQQKLFLGYLGQLCDTSVFKPSLSQSHGISSNLPWHRQAKATSPCHRSRPTSGFFSPSCLVTCPSAMLRDRHDIPDLPPCS